VVGVGVWVSAVCGAVCGYVHLVPPAMPPMATGWMVLRCAGMNASEMMIFPYVRADSRKSLQGGVACHVSSAVGYQCEWTWGQGYLESCVSLLVAAMRCAKGALELIMRSVSVASRNRSVQPRVDSAQYADPGVPVQRRPRSHSSL
jgi:hypothetical protein